MRTILVSGASGLVGRSLCEYSGANGSNVRTLSRGKDADFQWDLQAGSFNMAALEGVDAVVHLAGETVAQRWTTAARRRIRDSRVKGTRLLVQSILRSQTKPVFISASGINYYGYQQAEKVDECSPRGDGFLADVCREWEDELSPLEEVGIRCVRVRTGVVLSPKGGAMAKILPPFRAGVGGVIGSGNQRMSWITLSDLVRVFAACIDDKRYSGPLNAVAPHSIDNRGFTDALAGALRRPAIFPLPAKVVKLMFGAMATETLLSDLDVNPRRLIENGFEWIASDLDAAFKKEFGYESS